MTIIVQAARPGFHNPRRPCSMQKPLLKQAVMFGPLHHHAPKRVKSFILELGRV
jgi:hypothetical protein